MSTAKFTFGADPEFFIESRKDGRIIPAWMVPDLKLGTKGASEPLIGTASGILLDGATLELNTQAFPSMMRLSASIRKAEVVLSEILAAHGYDLSKANSWLNIPTEYMQDERIAVLGCDPDFSSWELYGNERPPPKPEALGRRRFSGAHLHIGVDPWPAMLPKNYFVEFLDLMVCNAMEYANLPSDFVCSGYRAGFYGYPGLFRPKSYGVEYRSLGFSWWHYPKFYRKLEGDIKSIVKLASSEDGIKELGTIHSGHMARFEGGRPSFRDIWGTAEHFKEKLLYIMMKDVREEPANGG